jgi:hypothetical protein
MMCEGNPFAVETLFCCRHCYQTEIWQELRELRKTVLNRQTVRQMLSYVENQMKKHKDKKSMPGKRMYHVVRLLFEAKRIINGEEPVVYWEVKSIRYNFFYHEFL